MQNLFPRHLIRQIDKGKDIKTSGAEECFIDQHFGFIKLGSRVDVYLPVGTEVCVTMNQKTTGNQTILAKLK